MPEDNSELVFAFPVAVRDDARKPVLDRVAERELLLVDELEDDRRGERLGQAADAVAIGHAHPRARRDGAQAARQARGAIAVTDEHGGARSPRGDDAVERVLELRRRLGCTAGCDCGRAEAGDGGAGCQAGGDRPAPAPSDASVVVCAGHVAAQPPSVLDPRPCGSPGVWCKRACGRGAASPSALLRAQVGEDGEHAAVALRVLG